MAPRSFSIRSGSDGECLFVPNLRPLRVSLVTTETSFPGSSGFCSFAMYFPELQHIEPSPHQTSICCPSKFTAMESFQARRGCLRWLTQAVQSVSTARWVMSKRTVVPVSLARDSASLVCKYCFVRFVRTKSCLHLYPGALHRIEIRWFQGYAGVLIKETLRRAARSS